MISYRQEVYRKLIHLSSLFWVAFIWYFQQFGAFLTLFFGALWLGTMLVERAYVKKVPLIYPLYHGLFGRMLRAEPRPEQWVVSGAAPVWLAAFFVCLAYPQQIAAYALSIMLVADTAAALFGRKVRVCELPNGKSLGGVLAFLVCGTAVWAAWCYGATQFAFGQWYWALSGIVLAAGAELFEKQLHIDDNFSIAALTGLSLALPAYWQGCANLANLGYPGWSCF